MHGAAIASQIGVARSTVGLWLMHADDSFAAQVPLTRQGHGAARLVPCAGPQQGCRLKAPPQLASASVAIRDGGKTAGHGGAWLVRAAGS